MEATGATTEPIWTWGLPLTPYRLADAVDRIDELIDARTPRYLITANLHYAMLSDQSAELRDVNRNAAFIVADGMPLVWASRLQKTPLPERVAGSDLIWRLGELAARRGRRLYLLGGAPGVAVEAARKLEERFPGLVIAGTHSPPFRTLTAEEHSAMLAQIRTARPDILVVAFGQPKGELWVARHCEELGAPVSIQLGASLDFVAGKVRRAPRWMQRSGLEWTFRFMQEPRRLAGRYARNILFLARMLFRHTRPAHR